ncbi:aminotransferase class V-fold PLP-dependent enzyme [Aminipila butyrica]|uniref:Aminotransferase class V-fold PLP-dependent enzyme n=1 Tax=Aminipila butyrica TaxID=433296 RepID=A0A858BX24_9FIRM|nr:aminotransferase class V-fold PLP-dependent enzyme [Aminipila butyrica]QIB69658.1 aminotransferase class V-fold PLP-dependent enzyme [Aminipila butyrica]
MKEQRGITSFLMAHRSGNPVSFHMPGHKGARLYRQFGYDSVLDHLMDCDITEIQGADNLFQAEGIIRETMAKYEELYQVRKSYLLVNGTSGGLIAAILSAVKPGGKLLLARNCHKSVFNAMSLGRIQPAYIYPQMLDQFGISGQVEPEAVRQQLLAHPDAEAVILTSPNYYGICSDIQQIADLVHKAGKILIIDQAHGAHLKFFSRFSGEETGTGTRVSPINEEGKDEGNGRNPLPKAAEECGADVVINSIHKTLASFTQSAVLNVVSERIDLDLLEDKLQLVESTSPSYLLMSSLDINANLLLEQGPQLMGQWRDHLLAFYKEARQLPGLRLIDKGTAMDWTKINLDMSAWGLSGHEAEALLLEQNIFAELVTGNILMCMSGIGNVKSDYDRLLQTLEDLCHKRDHGRAANAKVPAGRLMELARAIPEPQKLYPLPERKELVSLSDAVGQICALSIIPYPPGIPLVCPGEVISSEAVAYVKALKEAGQTVMGLSPSGQVAVGGRPAE